MKFSTVCPIHNEEKTIPCTIPSIYSLKPNEAIFVLDRCTDRSLDHIKKLHGIYGTHTSLKVFTVEEKSDYLYQPAYLRRLAYSKAENDIIFNTSADFIIDPHTRKHFKELKDNVKIVKFGFLDHPPTIQGFLRQLYSKYTPWKSYSGLYLLDRNALLETEDTKSLKKTYCEDTHCIRAIESKYDSRYFNTHTLHIRPNETVMYDRQRGVNYAETLNASLPRTLFTSMAMLRPHLFTSYLHTRRRSQ